uniref:Melatonin receptor 1a n=1 Tax=Sinocyclocheilus grahami TaxID=75366 RepID=A0A672K9T1_SINGR
MFMNGSFLNSSALDPSEQALDRPPWVTTTLGCFLIFTIVVDILGNLLVIFSVYRNKKLRNAADNNTDRMESERRARTHL